jgi:hypothetical protein
MSTLTAGNVTVSCSLSADTSGNLVFQSGGNVTAMTIDSSQNVGIGASSPGSKLQVSGIISSVGSGTSIFAAGETGTYTLTGVTSPNYGISYGTLTGGSNPALTVSGYDAIAFGTSQAERARIDSSGNFMVGRSDTGFTSGQPGMLVLPTQGITFTKTNSPNLGACMYLHRTFGAGTGNLVEFAYDTVVRGSISTNGTGVTYGTASDYRLKENVQPMTGALAKVSALKPCTYKWKVDASDGEGFIAHELAEVVPGCVTGEKDAVDADGKPVYQGIDTSFLVATLTAAIQEQQQMIEELKAKVAALEAA